MAGGGARAVHLLITVIRTSKVQRILNPTVLGSQSGCCLFAPTCYFSVNSTSSSVKIPAPGDTKDVDHFPCLHKSV